MRTDTVADLPAPDPLMAALAATTRVMVEHEARCPGCQHRLHCPIYWNLVKAEQAILDAACRAMQEGP